MLALDPAQQSRVAWQPRRPPSRAGLSDVHETRLDEMAQPLRQPLGSLVIDEPAVEATPVQLQPLKCRKSPGLYDLVPSERVAITGVGSPLNTGSPGATIGLSTELCASYQPCQRPLVSPCRGRSITAPSRSRPAMIG